MRTPSQLPKLTISHLLLIIAMMGSMSALSGQFSDALEAKAHGEHQYAFANFYQLALQGDANAMFELSLLYSSGKGVESDMKQAMRWLKQAASHGSVQAQSNLGVAFNRGLSVPQNGVKAFIWLSMASSSGDSIAITNLEIVTKRLSEMQLKKAKTLLFECQRLMPLILAIPECV